jgi:hypothetical protein
MKFCVAILLLTLAATGCMSQARIREQERAAFLAGENAALRQEWQSPGVTIIGPVKYSHVPWVDGLSLAQAIATADYLNPNPPQNIAIICNGQTATLSPDVLLRGVNIPLKSGDVVKIQPQ